MVSNRIAVAALGLACVAAAGGGSYLATRHNVTTVATPAAASASEVAARPSQPVKDSEPAAALAETATVSNSESTPVSSAPEKAPSPSATSERPRAVPVPAPAAPPQRTAKGLPAHSPEVATLERPSIAASAGAQAQSAESQQPLPARIQEPRAEAPRQPEPAKRLVHLDELVVSADSVIGLQMESSLSTERARVEDRITARVVRDVRVGGAVAIPAGTRAMGNVVVVERGGRFKEQARLGIRFHTLVLADNTNLPITTDTIYRMGEGPSNGTAARIGGGAVVGAIIGGIVGGGKGAAIGATTGAGAGTASVMSTDRSEATFPAGAQVTARVLSPFTVTVERE